jgi:hypothetical protein
MFVAFLDEFSLAVHRLRRFAGVSLRPGLGLVLILPLLLSSRRLTWRRLLL